MSQSGGNTNEDARMLAFFDALVQRDIAGLSEESDVDSNYTNTVYSTENSTSDDEGYKLNFSINQESSSQWTILFMQVNKTHSLYNMV